MDTETFSNPIGISDDVLQMTREIQAKERSQAEKDVRLIEDIDEDFSLFSWGWTSPLKRTKDREVEYFSLKIKSIGLSEIIEEMQTKSPVPPSTLRTYKRDSEVVRQLGQKHDVVVWEQNEADPTYQRERTKFNNEFGKMLLLHSLAYDIKDNGKIVLKGKNLSEPNEVVDPDAAMKVIFRKWGITTEHFATITGDIRRLTESKEIQEEGE